MNILELFHKGGLVMYPLMVCSIIAIAILFERVKVYRKAASNIPVLVQALPPLAVKKDWDGIRAACENDGGAAAGIIAAAVANTHQVDKQKEVLETLAMSEAAKLRRYLRYLETIVTLAPLLGLLGTVTGMIGSFSVLAVSEGQPFAITGGVGEALIATATGLCVAILALIIHTYLVQREDVLIAQMEELSSVYTIALTGDTHEA